MGVKVEKDANNIPKLLKLIEQLQSKRVEVGILGDSGSYDDGTSILLIAQVHEFGAPSINIPERSFLRAYFDENEKQIYSEMEALLYKTLDNLGSANGFYEYMGEYLIGEVKNYIVKLKSPPLKASTIKAKGSSNPLVDTGRLVDSIDYRVV